MSKLLLFIVFTVILGNPFVALLVLLLILYVLDRRFLGFFPNLLKPLQTTRRIAKLKQELNLSPFNHSLKLELARLYLDRKKYEQALPYLEEAYHTNPESEEIKAELGLALMKTGELEKGVALLEKALEGNARVKYGAPLLQLADAYTEKNPEKAAAYLERFKDIQSSSCEAYYRLGQLYTKLGRTQEAAEAYKETVDLYNALPRYKKKAERRWAVLARMKRK